MCEPLWLRDKILKSRLSFFKEDNFGDLDGSQLGHHHGSTVGTNALSRFKGRGGVQIVPLGLFTRESAAKRSPCFTPERELSRVLHPVLGSAGKHAFEVVVRTKIKMTSTSPFWQSLQRVTVAKNVRSLYRTNSINE